MFCFGILRTLEEITKRGKLENLEKIGLISRSVGNPRRSIGNPRRSVDLCQVVGSLAAARSRYQNGTPRIRRGIAVTPQNRDVR